MQNNQPSNVLALDIGAKRIGVARASTVAKLPEALTALVVDGQEIAKIQALRDEYSIDLIVVGLPRSLDGQETQQTTAVREYTAKLDVLERPLIFQDEALTSHKAEAELGERKKKFAKGEVDSLAAVYILEDWLRENT